MATMMGQGRGGGSLEARPATRSGETRDPRMCRRIRWCPRTPRGVSRGPASKAVPSRAAPSAVRLGPCRRVTPILTSVRRTLGGPPARRTGREVTTAAADAPSADASARSTTLRAELASFTPSRNRSGPSATSRHLSSCVQKQSKRAAAQRYLATGKDAANRWTWTGPSSWGLRAL